MMETQELAMFTQTVKYSGNYIWVKPVCEFFRLDVRNQHKKIKSDPVLRNLVGKNTPDWLKNENLVGKNHTDYIQTEPDIFNLRTKKSGDFGEIDQNGRILLTKRGFVRWIQIINANTIPQELRDQFITYQMLVFDYIYGSFEREEQVKVDYVRLKKLRRLYSVIGREIQRVEEQVRLYMDSRYTQLSLPLKETKHIN